MIAPPPQLPPIKAGDLIKPLTPLAARPSSKAYGLASIATTSARRICLYGSGGVGKTSAAARAPGPVAVIDLDESLPVLLPTLRGLDIKVASGVTDWADLRATINDHSIFAGVKTIVIDSATKAEQLAIAHTLATVKTEKGETVKSVDGYGYGRGPQFVFDTFLCLFGDLDAHIRAGRNVILICHDCTANVPNPMGQDYIRYEPRLQSPSSGKASIRLTLKEWCDHLLFIGYDVAAGKDGKATGSGTRAIYPLEMPTFMAKTRSLKAPIVYEEGSSEVWNQIFGK